MSHIHGVIDTDAHFIVDPTTKTLKPDPTAKLVVVQFDHNSERISFEVPRYGLDGHDMSLCNSVEVHYTNTDRGTNEKKTGVYQVEDLQLSQTEEDVVVCSWLISRKATQLVGPLSFSIRFACIGENGEEEYGLGTAAYSNYSVVAGVYNPSGADEYPDILKQHSARLTEHARRIEEVEDSTVRHTAQELSTAQKAQARENIGAAVSTAATDEIYFDITPEGEVSLKPEYRGAYSGTSTSSAPYWSDNGGKRDGTQNKELPEEIIIPEVVDGVSVTALVAHMFHGNKRVKRIVLPSCIDAIPEGFCNAAVNLEEVQNTEHIKTLGSHAFAKTALRVAYFPSIIGFPTRSNGNAPTSHFSSCANLVVADLGPVFSAPGAAVPGYCFANCEKLARLRNAGGITSIGDFGLYLTRRIAGLPFLPNLASVGNYGLLLSRADYDWGKLTGCTFGTLSTSKDVNTTDYSGCTFTACNTPMRSTFEQHDPRWADKNIGNSANKYTTGCATVAAAMIYSALMGVDMESPEEFVAAVGAVDESLLDLDIADGVNNTTGEGDFWSELVRWFDAVGLRATIYDSVSAANVQTMYDALAGGALVWARILGDATEGNHCVVFHGVNSSGELLVADSSSASSDIGVYEAATYALPVQNFMRDHGQVDYFMVVTKK